MRHHSTCPVETKQPGISVSPDRPLPFVTASADDDDFTTCGVNYVYMTLEGLVLDECFERLQVTSARMMQTKTFSKSEVKS